MRNGFKVFDADAHVIYPADLWARYLDKKFQHRLSRKQPIPGTTAIGPRAPVPIPTCPARYSIARTRRTVFLPPTPPPP